MWRGEFERSGDQPSSMIFLFRKPEDRRELNGATIEYFDDDGVVTKTVWQRVEGVLDDIILEDAATAEREAISFSRQDLLNALKWTGHSVSYRKAADAFTALAAQPLAFYKPLSRTHHIDVLRLRRADLAAWFEGSGLSWPRPAWLPATGAVELGQPTKRGKNERDLIEQESLQIEKRSSEKEKVKGHASSGGRPPGEYYEDLLKILRIPEVRFQITNMSERDGAKAIRTQWVTRKFRTTLPAKSPRESTLCRSIKKALAETAQTDP